MAKKFGESGIKFILAGLEGVFQKIADAVKSVNGSTADENGNIQIDTVPYANNLQSESSQRSVDTFINRTSGGGSSISNGEAWLMKIRGNNVHDGFVAEQIDMDVTGDEITAEIDRDTFVEYVASSGTITLVYSSSWSADPSLYGITVTGTPAAGDTIVVTYVKEERGTITVANPTSFVSTGWNLFNASEGYARVVKYAHGYRIDGAYTALQYAATLTGVRSSVTVTNGNFDIPADGYVFVTGGDSTTAIYAVWEDWTDGYPGEMELYAASVVDLTDVMSEKFPNGLMKAGSVLDEIDLNLGQAIVRVERMAYSAENLATAKASGREYEYDTDYIYIAKASAVTSSITVNGSVNTNDHGIEYFAGTDAGVNAEILYGSNLRNKLERDTVTISPMDLTDAQKKQIRESIGAAEDGLLVVESKTVFDNKTIAAGSFEDVSYSVAKTGYTPIAVAGYNVSNGSSSGNGRTSTVLTKLYISSNNLTVSMKNSSSASVKVKLNVYVLYMKNK